MSRNVEDIHRIADSVISREDRWHRARMATASERFLEAIKRARGENMPRATSSVRNSTPPREIVALVAKQMGSSLAEVMGFSRMKPVVHARHACYYVLNRCGYSHGQIGNVLGGRNPSSVSAAMARFEQTATPEMRAVIARFLEDGE